jgi:predicted N-acetyltransferase YhbS
MTITYSVEQGLSPEEFIDVLDRSGLAERRPVEDRERVARMVKNANLIVTARENGTLIGVARSVTDFSYCCYLSDLAVDRAYQRLGIGKELMRRTHEAAGEECALLLLSAPAAMDYYPHVGFEKAENAFIVRREK